jgi:predicted DNA-binding transcriptional regulator YafY
MMGMNRIERLAAVLLLLQERPHTSDEISRRFEVSRRTILRDVQALSEMGVPVIAREGPGGGYSLASDYRTEPLPLTGNEAFLLLLALDSLRQLSDLPFKREMTSLETKLRALLPQSRLSGAHELLASIGQDVPPREQRAPFLEDLLNAAKTGSWVRMLYHSAERSSTLHILPQQIYAQNGLWYCAAYTHERGENRTYRVDRIQAVEPAQADFQPGPIRQSLPYDHPSHPEIRAHLTPRGADLVETEQHIGSHVRRIPGQGGELALRCPPGELDWYARYFAGLGAEVEVFAPSELREKMAQLGQQLLDHYQKR